MAKSVPSGFKGDEQEQLLATAEAIHDDYELEYIS
jgi:hypothetical protein